MRTHLMVLLSLCVLAINTSYASAEQYDRRFMINNNTLHDIQEIRMRGYNETAQKRESLDFYQQVLPGTATVVKPANTDLCVFDLIVVVFPQNRIAHKENVDVCRKFIWEISEDDLEPMSDRYDDLD